LNTLSTIILSVGLAALTAVVPLYQDSSNSQEMGSNLRNNTQLVYEPYLYQNKGLNLENKEDLKSLIRQEAERYNIDANLMIRIAWCESRIRMIDSELGDYGIYQFRLSTWEYFTHKFNLTNFDINNPLDQIELAARIISEGGLHHWNSSRSCWQR